MNIETFLKDNKQSINAFANKHGIPATTVWRAVKRKVIRPGNALLISTATKNLVTTDELLFPDQKGART